MKNIKRRFNLKYALEWEYEVEISKIREDLDAIEKLGATHVGIDASVSYDCADLSIDAISNRMETDEECIERIRIEKQRSDTTKNHELEQLRMLQLKYKGQQ